MQKLLVEETKIVQLKQSISLWVFYLIPKHIFTLTYLLLSGWIAQENMHINNSGEKISHVLPFCIDLKNAAFLTLMISFYIQYLM